MFNYVAKIFLICVLIFSNPILMDKCSLKSINNLLEAKVKCNVTKNEDCSIQSIDNLEKLFQYHFGKPEDSLRIYEVPNLRQDYEVVDLISNKTPSYCDYETLGDEFCSSDNENIKRSDRYPFERVEIQCNCSNCNTGIDYIRLSCIQVKKHYPVLIRGDCNLVSREYEWRPGLERVSIACVCARRPGITHRKFKSND